MKKWAAAALAATFALGAITPAFADNGDRGNRGGRGNHYGWSNQNRQCNSNSNRKHHRDGNENDNDNDRDNNNGGYNNGGYNNGGYNNGGYNNGGYNNGGYNNGGYNNGGYNNGGYNNNGNYNNGNCYAGQNGQNGANTRIYGTIVSVDGDHVVLQSGGRRIDVNDQPALDNQASGRVSVGRTLTAYGYWQGNVFYATRLV